MRDQYHLFEKKNKGLTSIFEFFLIHLSYSCTHMVMDLDCLESLLYVVTTVSLI